MKTIIIMCFCTVYFVCRSQNLVFNPSIEDTVSCAQWNNSWPKLPCLGWYQSISSPDLWSTSYTNGCGSVLLPQSFLGYQNPKSGHNCLAFSPSIFPFFIDYKECVTGKLLSPLLFGRKYYVQFYVSSCDNCQLRVDRIGAYLSKDSINPDSNYLFSVIPQVESLSGNIIQDTANWTEINGYFIAQGGEKWITIGCFQPDSNLLFDSIPNWINPGGYYFLDDVGVVDCTATSIIEVNKIEFQLQNNPALGILNFTSNEKIISCVVFDLIGNKVMEKNMADKISKYEIDVSTLKQGMYLLMVEDKNKKVGYKKFIKM